MFTFKRRKALFTLFCGIP